MGFSRQEYWSGVPLPSRNWLPAHKRVWLTLEPACCSLTASPTLINSVLSFCLMSGNSFPIHVWATTQTLRELDRHREGNGTPLQHSCLENPMGGGAWWAAVHGVAKSQARLRDFTFTFHFHALEKEMAAHSSVLAWRIPGKREPGGLPSMGSHRVGHD